MNTVSMYRKAERLAREIWFRDVIAGLKLQLQSLENQNKILQQQEHLIRWQLQMLEDLCAQQKMVFAYPLVKKKRQV